ncbi:pterin-4-alpha-carbinolamine dehydratase family protein [Stachybotrys elegans]|uniref:4a-hydroxytetrahydrobiopterin dehydratase n=1 Tax=Stachybotrys elegans TaxID=80388 RepID=A0A8K0T669_9HYPO|nr:pterin-4-alpha-carbinolamine dehydratase family protein [Stachybotrys elegans]
MTLLLRSPPAHLRPFLSQTHRRLLSAAATMQPRFAPGTDEPAVSAQLHPLLASSGGRWTLASEGEALERSFKFKTFAKTWDFMTAVSLQCKMKNHHPEWSNVYNTTFIRWTTHSPKGLSAKDVTLASLCDSIAKELGELDPEPASCQVKDLADKVATTAGDCCVPKK